MSVFGDGSHNDVKTVYYKAANVKTDRPNFEKWMGKEQEPQTVDWVAGILYKIERSEFEYDGNVNHKVAYFLSNEDGTETKSISCGWPTFYNKDFLNRLSNLDSISAIKMLLWSSHDENSGKDYTRGSIHNLSKDGETGIVKGRFPHSEIPKKKEVKVGSKTVWDDEEQDAFYVKLLEEYVKPKLKFTSLEQIKAHYEGSTPPDAKLNKEASKSFKGKDVPVGVDGEEFDDDVPF